MSWCIGQLKCAGNFQRVGPLLKQEVDIMNRIILIAGVVLLGASQSYSETYSWTNDIGVLSFTDDPGLIPPKYRAKAQKGEDITIQNPKVQQSLKEQELKAKEELNSRPQIDVSPDYVAAPVVAPAKPITNEQPASRTRSQKIRDNIERREKELAN
jgi:hypothetical protein